GAGEAALVDRRPDERSEFGLSELLGQVALDDRLFGQFGLRGLLAPALPEGLGGLTALFRLLDQHFHDLGVVEFTGGPAGDLLVADRREDHSQRAERHLVPRLEGGPHIRFQLGLQLTHISTIYRWGMKISRGLAAAAGIGVGASALALAYARR